MIKSALLITLLALCAASVAWGVPSHPAWVVSEFRFPEPRPFEEVQDICESADGTLWMASWGGGVGSFQETRSRFYTTEDGLPSNFVASLAIDPEGRVWVGTALGLSMIEGGGVVALQHPNPLETADTINALLWRPDGTLWAGLSEGFLTAYDPASGSWRILWQHPDSAKDGISISSFHEDPAGTVWVAMSMGGLLRIEGEAIEWIRPDTIPIPRVKSLVTHPDGTLWAAGAASCGRFDGRAWDMPVADFDCVALAMGPGNKVFVGTSSGVLTHDDTGVSPIPMTLRHGAPLVRTIFFDSMGTGWVGTKEGVLKVKRPRWRSTSHTPAAVHTLHHAFHARPDSPPLAVNTEGLVVRFDNGAWIPMADLGILPWPGARMLLLPDNRLWVSVQQTVREADLTTGRVIERPDLPGGALNGLAQGPGNTPLAFGIDGVVRWDGQGWAPFQPEGSDDRSDVKSVEPMADGTLLVCRAKSIETWTDVVSVPVYTAQGPGPDFTFEHAIEAADGTLWIASYAVLHLSASGEVLGQIDVPGTRRTRRILESADGTMWFGSQSKGVASLRDGRLIMHTHADGIPSDSLSALGEHPENVIWAATANNGLFRYLPVPGKPETYIVARSDSLPANGIAVFSVAGYDAWDDTPAEELEFSWRLTRVSHGEEPAAWSPFTSGETIVTPPLRPGRYHFEVRAADKDRNTDPSPAQAELLVLAPLWARAEFLLPLSAAVLIAAALGMRSAWSRRRLRESERNYRTLFNAASDGMIVHETGTGRVVDANRKAEMILGWTCDEMVAGLPVAYPYSLEGLDLGTGETYRTERFAIRRDGSAFWADISLTRAVIAGKPRWLATLRDASRRRAALEENLRLARAVDQVAEMILITDMEGTILYANPAFERITGYDRGDILGKNPRILKSGRQDDAFYRDLWRTLTRTGQWSGRLTNARKDGSLYEQVMSITSLRDESGKVVHFVAVSRDVTEETRMEARLRQAQKLEAIGTLAGGIAHDFNNLLAPIIGYTELVMEELPGDHQARANLQAVLAASERARTLVQQILAFSRQTGTERQSVNVRDVVAEALKLLRASIPTTISFELQLNDGVGTVFAHPSHIHQIIMNLGTNAYHAMEKDGGTLRVALARFVPDAAFISIHARITPASEYIQITVSDTGHGMREADMARIFDPFFTTKDQGRGTGLGLATVHGIVTELGGDISVYSELGAGTTFHVYLPCTSTEKAADTVAVKAAPRGNGECVLVVDDEPAILGFTAQLLTALNYRPVTIGSSPDALAMVREHPDDYDLVLSDLTMPSLTGIQLAMSVASIRRGLPVILMTGFSDTLTRDHAANAGINCILHKPFTTVALAQALRDALSPAEQSTG